MAPAHPERVEGWAELTRSLQAVPLHQHAPPHHTPVRWLGIDPGAARVGIAACDEEERVAVPLEVVPASVAVPAIRTHAQREGVGGIVVGLPLSMDGTEGPSAAAARRLGERVRRVLNLPVEYEDERLTSVAAERGSRGRSPRDDIAAALLLQQFIDRRRRDAELAE